MVQSPYQMSYILMLEKPSANDCIHIKKGTELQQQKFCFIEKEKYIESNDYWIT